MTTPTPADATASQPQPKPATVTTHTLTLGGDAAPLPYTAEAGWLLLRERDRPIAEVFFTYYRADLAPDADAQGGAQGDAPRSVTFVFNGGPGASSAYLHMAALGPRRVVFNDDGTSPPPPARLTDNAESWLPFTDLVFIDPVGTGLSRALDAPHPHDPKDAKDDDLRHRRHQSYWTTHRDLDALAEFMQRFLTAQRRWGSPVFIAGESYGGYRVAKLIRKLQADYGIGLNGAILISPVVEFSTLEGDDYGVAGWCDLVPTMAAAAYHHGRARTTHPTLAAHVAAAEAFALHDLTLTLTLGASQPEAERRHTLRRLADLIGLHLDDVTRCGGRVRMDTFCRLLLRDQGKFLGRYDAAVTAHDPFPDREQYEGPDPTLWGMSRQFTPAVHMQLDHLRVQDDRAYILINEEIFKQWRFEVESSPARMGFPAAADDLRHGMALNPHTRVMINHGLFDLVTPYFASNHLAALLRLPPEDRDRLTLQHFHGGHMFYTWRDSRVAFTAAARAFYAAATGT